MLDQDFCDFLEYKITAVFQDLDDEAVKGFWCDGVLLPTNERGHLSLQHVKHHRKIISKAFICKEVETVYELVLKIGDKALNNYTRNLDLKECVPYTEDLNWFAIDIEKRIISIQLE